jgi:hypothetical protein
MIAKFKIKIAMAHAVVAFRHLQALKAEVNRMYCWPAAL